MKWRHAVHATFAPTAATDSSPCPEQGIICNLKALTNCA
ncbi:uncharacterized protein Dana_GF27533, isoform A [Drosophila ananassae]|uniref:Uncharacterized protein, isoform A n=1 Tax=Drosophila ananassae TaxID=7217 RepID=A0A0P9C9Y9_DROAN|nr:uncharacterized protein Dana_GF27533, isoform A [Drosophila ananassae]